jgi:hypothetical protein
MAIITSKRLMYWVMMYSTPHILRLLGSLDFLNNNVQKVDGKTPFFDDETVKMQVSPKRGGMPFVRKRPDIHLKDSWNMRFTTKESENTAIVYLSNLKRDSKGKWIIADLLWYGTSTYNIEAPDIKLTIPVWYKEVIYSSIPGVGQTQAKGRIRRDTVTQTLIKGHHTGAMTYYNRYTGSWFYNRKTRMGIRDQLVKSFQEYILLCVENGIRIGIDEMVREGVLKVDISGIHVRILK